MEYGLIGNPLGHSYSKPIHESLADYTYEIHPLEEEEFSPFMEKKEFLAINVTIPYKQKVIPYLDEMDEHAKEINAVNTIVNRDGTLKGYNTDYLGFDYMLRKHAIQLEGKKVVILGNGGAAQAIKAVVNSRDVRERVIVDVVASDESISYEACLNNHTDAEVIINTSPVGMYPNVEASPLDLTPFTKLEAVLDVIYNPIETALTAQAKSMGLIGVTGLEMLVAQALYAVEIFLDVEISEEKIPPIYEKIKKMLENG